MLSYRLKIGGGGGREGEEWVSPMGRSNTNGALYVNQGSQNFTPSPVYAPLDLDGGGVRKLYQ